LGKKKKKKKKKGTSFYFFLFFFLFSPHLVSFDSSPLPFDDFEE